MTDDCYAGVSSAENRALLRPTLMAIVLVVAGVGLWMWEDEKDNAPSQPSLLIVSQSR
jgi:hypothetical protein